MMQLVTKLPQDAVYLEDLDLYVCPGGSIFREMYRAVMPSTYYRLQVAKDGTVSITIGGQRKKFSAARLVARAFVLNPDNLPDLQHIDGNARNNAVSNLRWIRRADRFDSRVHKSVVKYGGHLSKTVDGKVVHDDETRAARRVYYATHKEAYARANRKYQATKRLRKLGVAK